MFYHVNKSMRWWSVTIYTLTIRGRCCGALSPCASLVKDWFVRALAFSSSCIILHRYTCGLLVLGSLFLTILKNYHTILLLHSMGRGIPSVKAKFTHYWEDRWIKGFHLNVNQKCNKSIIVIWKRTALFAFHVMSLTLFLPLALAPQIRTPV